MYSTYQYLSHLETYATKTSALGYAAVRKFPALFI